jgi:hypothetical protein
MPNEIKVDYPKKIVWKDRKTKKIESAKRSETFTLNSVQWKKNVKECLLCKSMKKKRLPCQWEWKVRWLKFKHKSSN